MKNRKQIRKNILNLERQKEEIERKIEKETQRYIQTFELLELHYDCEGHEITPVGFNLATNSLIIRLNNSRQIPVCPLSIYTKEEFESILKETEDVS